MKKKIATPRDEAGITNDSYCRAVRGAATAGMRSWNCYPMRFHRERFGPKTSRWQKSLKMLLYLPTNRRTSMQMVNLAAIRSGRLVAAYSARLADAISPGYTDRCFCEK